MVLFFIISLCGDVHENPGPQEPSVNESFSCNTLSIYHLNIRSLRNKICDIIHIVEEHDIVFFTESHLDFSVHSENIQLPGFDVPIRRDRNNAGGGLIVYFKNHLNFRRRADLELPDLESMWFELRTKRMNTLINIVYRSERFCGPNFWELFDQTLKAALDECPNIIVLGDLNKNFLSNLPNIIKDIFTMNGLSNLIVKPTNFFGNTETLLDPILVTNSVPVLESDTIHTDRRISDHDGTYVVIDSGYNNNKSYLRKVWNYKRARYDLLRNKVAEADWFNLIERQTDVNIACKNFTDTLIEICNECIPSQSVLIRENDKVWFNSDLRRAIRIRDRLRKKFLKNKTPNNQSRYKAQRNKVNNMKKHAIEQFYLSINETLSDLKTSNSKLYWKTIKMLLKGDNPSNNIPPLCDPLDTSNLVFDNNDKCDLLNQYFCSVTNIENRDKHLPDFDDRGREIISDVVIFEQDVLDVLSNLNPNKAVGPDSISNRMLIAVKNEIARPLCMLFNKSIRLSTFPSEWKLAHVIALYKKGDKSIVSNYRPVALLSCTSKILEKILYKFIFNHLFFNDLIYKYQSGFLPGFSTVHQLIELYHEILLSIDSSHKTCITFCDVSKAFDRVWIKGLLYKLECYGIKGKLLLWLKSYLDSRKQKVIIMDGKSSVGSLYAGVPQGSVLGPLLFLIYVNDLSDNMVGLCRLFADDTSIGHVAHDDATLMNMTNMDLENISKWSNDWLVKLNPDKTDIMVFSSNNRARDLVFTFSDSVIEPVNSHRHLGLVFSSDCKWTKHIDTLIDRTSKQLNILRKLKFKLSREFLERIYFTFIRPILEYACEVWDNCGVINTERIEKVQLEAARIVTGLTSYASKESLYKETGWDTLKSRREQKKLLLFYNIVQGHCPEYLTDLLPPLVSDNTPYNLRNNNNFRVPLSRLSLYQQSFLPATLNLWNDLDSTIRESPSSDIFKLRLKLKYRRNNNNSKPPSYYLIGKRYTNLTHARIRNKCSALKFDLFRANIIQEKNCSCGALTENAEHFFLYCPNYDIQRNRLFFNLSDLETTICVNTFLFGDNNLNDELNALLFSYVQSYIEETGRFQII